MAYMGLDRSTKARVQNLVALNSMLYAGARAGYHKVAADLALQARLAQQYPPQPHPVIRVHPETGKALIYVNDLYTGAIVGLDDAASRELRRHLIDQIKTPEYQVRVRWTPDTIVVWDNISVQHYAVGGYTEPRRMERVTLAGDKPPIGLSGAPAALN
jgi:taurine dioxygenase